MGIFENVPYTNFHDLNLDSILKQVKELYTLTKTWIENNNIQFADPVDWNIDTTYDANRIVYSQELKTAYISKKVVPAGTNITNTDFWLPVATIDAYPLYSATTETATFQGGITKN